MMPYGTESPILPDRLPNQTKSHSWETLVRDPNFSTANVSSFKHAPMNDFWDRLVTVGIKVEVINTDVDAEYQTQKQKIHPPKSKKQQSNAANANPQTPPTSNQQQPPPPPASSQKKKATKKENKQVVSNAVVKTEPTDQEQLTTNTTVQQQQLTQFKNICENPPEKVYWIATVIKVYGYLAKLRYEGYEEDGSHDFWVYLFSDDIHGVGWCASQGKALVPPKNILRKLPDWTMYLIKRLTGSRTLPNNFSELITDSLQTKFRKGMKLEVVDKNRISSVRVATVELTVGGRLLVYYDGAPPNIAGFWVHEKSSLVHPIGWAQFVSHELVATYEYARESLDKVAKKRFAPNDATWDMFDLPTTDLPAGERFETNMKLEAIDPLNLSSICVASVIKVLRSNYLMIGIDGSMCPTGSDWFCFHATSPNIFPIGFCKENNLELSNPKNEKNFDWNKYLEETNTRAAPASLFTKPIPNHGFEEGMMIEAVDLMQPRLVCLATITKIVGRLLRIHFNGWDDTFDQWCDCESPDLFPVGWCELVGYPLEPPRSEDSESAQQQSLPSDNQKRRRISSSKKLTKKKKVKTTTTTSTTTKTNNSTSNSVAKVGGEENLF